MLELVQVEVEPLTVLHGGRKAAVPERLEHRDRAVKAAVAFDNLEAVDDEQRRAGGAAGDGGDGEAAAQTCDGRAARASLRKIARAVEVQAGHRDRGEDGLRTAPVRYLLAQPCAR